jgi:hypothetical protein
MHEEALRAHQRAVAINETHIEHLSESPENDQR